MWKALQLLKRRRRRDADFSDEIAAHLVLEADRLEAEGRSPVEAAYEARRRFGNVGLAREAFHARRTIGWLADLPRQLGRAARALSRAPVFTGTAVITLALGIGATTAVFSLVDGVLLRPLPFAQPSRLVDLSHTLTVVGVMHVDQSDGTYLYYRAANRSFSGVGAYRAVTVNLADAGGTDAARAERVAAARMSASTFGVLGVAPLRGRALRDDEDPGMTPVAVLSERLWRDRYAADPGILRRVVTIDGVAHQIVGVMPERFAFPDAHTALWLPIEIDPTRTKTAAFDYRVVARLKPGVSVTAAQADLQDLLPHVPDAFPGRLTAPAIRVTHMEALVRPLADVIVGSVGTALWVILGAGAFLLLIACANVANLFLVRAEERGHELAVRRALGAGRGAVAGEFLAEGLLVAGLGGALGLGLAVAGLGALRSLASGVAIPRLDGVGLNGGVLAVAAGVSLATALVMSVAPALHAFGTQVASVLVQTGRGVTADRSRHRARRSFVVVQVALALVLVTGAGLMARTFRALRSVTPGFDAGRSYAFRASLPDASYPGTDATVGLVTRALDALTALPGVEAAGVMTKLPLDNEAREDTAIFVESRPIPMGGMPEVHQVVWTTPGAFPALGIPLLAGRAFEPPDPARAPLEAVVTRALARRYWGDSTPVGRRLRLSPAGPWFTVVGETGDIRGTRLDHPPDETVFVPLVTALGPETVDGGESDMRWAPRDLAFVLRTSARAASVTAGVQRTMQAVAPTLPIYGVRSMADVVVRSLARTSFTAELLEIASLAALLIGVVGLYGVVSYMVSLRAREMAVRLALGAAPAALRGLVLRQAAAVVAWGVVLGLGAALALTRSLASLLYGVAPGDPATLAAAAVLLTAVAGIASWLPARRAAATDPAAALRTDA